LDAFGTGGGGAVCVEREGGRQRAKADDGRPRASKEERERQAWKTKTTTHPLKLAVVNMLIFCWSSSRFKKGQLSHPCS